MRALAQRSAEAAKEIKALIPPPRSRSSTGVELVGETGEALQRSSARSPRSTRWSPRSPRPPQEQSTGLEQVNTAVNQMDQVTQQNAAMVEESTAASRSRGREGRAVRADLLQGWGEDPPRRSPRPPRARSRPRHPQADNAGSWRTACGGRRALKAWEDDDWEEF